jgi:transposase
MAKVWRVSVIGCVYMAALVALRHNPVFSAFYTRLVAADKPKKSVAEWRRGDAR